MMTGGTPGVVYTRGQQSGSAGSGWSAWREAGSDSGTMCGYKTGPGGNMGPNCMGYNPAAGCPTGYTQHYWSVSFGNGQLWFCSKN